MLPIWCLEFLGRFFENLFKPSLHPSNIDLQKKEPLNVTFTENTGVWAEGLIHRHIKIYFGNVAALWAHRMWINEERSAVTLSLRDSLTLSTCYYGVYI
jgi:hypothetical protein